MSIQNEIERINQNISNSYSAVQEMGGDIPEVQNSNNLADAIRTISGDGETTIPVKAPIGCIVWWSGTVDNIPTGWHLCDGTSGTIDLRDKFILSAGTDHSVGETGGSEEVTLTVAQLATHTHTNKISVTSYSEYAPIMSFGPGSGVANGVSILENAVTTTNRGTDVKVANTGQSKPHPNMPPYYTLCAIQKISADETDTDFTPDDTLTLKDGTLGVALPNKALTSAEYEALSEEEKMADVQYIITDDNLDGGNSGGSGGGTSEEIYSTEETRIGTWIDGKPLYRKTAEGVTPSGLSDGTVARFVDVKDIVKLYGLLIRTSGTHIPVPNVYGSSTIGLVSSGTGVVNCRVKDSNNEWYSQPIIIIAEYTKITD